MRTKILVSAKRETRIEIVRECFVFKVEAPCPLFNGETIKFKFRLRYVNRERVGWPDTYFALERHYSKRIGQNWKCYDVADDDLTYKRLPPRKRSRKNATVDARNVKVRLLAGRINARISSLLPYPET